MEDGAGLDRVEMAHQAEVIGVEAADRFQAVGEGDSGRVMLLERVDVPRSSMAWVASSSIA
jgi:hypothetical protein